MKKKEKQKCHDAINTQQIHAIHLESLLITTRDTVGDATTTTTYST
jgi:hypothetical protein